MNLQSPWRPVASLIWGLVWTLVTASCPAQAADRPPEAGPRPNILLITADDMNGDSPGCMGGTVPDITPHIDRLAGEGMRFLNAHVPIAVCTPSRSAWLTGRYPHRNGVEGFQRIREDVPTLPAVLGEAGYVCGVIGKPLGQQEKFRWSSSYKYPHPGDEDMWGRDPAVFYRFVRTFFQRAADSKRPFFLLANSHDPHRPFHGSDDERRLSGPGPREAANPSRTYRPEEVPVPGFLPDIPAVRRELAQYYSSVRRCDDTVGEILRALDESGQRGNTVVMFLSDHGMSFPFAKTNCYRQSTHVPWVIRWPGKIKPGSVDSHRLVSGIDLMPTLLEITDVPLCLGMDGSSLLPLLAGQAVEGWDKVFTQFNHIHGRHPYPMRAVHTARFTYIFNPWSNGHRIYSAEPLDGLTFAAMEQAAAADPEIAARVRMLRYRTVEEFYDLQRDPHAQRNIINSPACGQELNTLRQELQAWQKRTGDPALEAFENRQSAEALERFMEKYTDKAGREIKALDAYEKATGYRF